MHKSCICVNFIAEHTRAKEEATKVNTLCTKHISLSLFLFLWYGYIIGSAWKIDFECCRFDPRQIQNGNYSNPYPSIYLSIYHFIHLSIYLSIISSIYLSIYLLSIYLFIYLSVFYLHLIILLYDIYCMIILRSLNLTCIRFSPASAINAIKCYKLKPVFMQDIQFHLKHLWAVCSYLAEHLSSIVSFYLGHCNGVQNKTDCTMRWQNISFSSFLFLVLYFALTLSLSSSNLF